MSNASAGKDPKDKSTGELVKDLTEQLGRLTRNEIELAMRETRRKGRHAGLGAVSAGAGGVLALYGGGAIMAGIVLLVARALAVPTWGGALIVGAVTLVGAGIAALIARAQLRRAAPLPSASVESAKEDVQTVKEAARR